MRQNSKVGGILLLELLVPRVSKLAEIKIMTHQIRDHCRKSEYHNNGQEITDRLRCIKYV
jgi:hypothetical protein